jgi:hypothetical protein
LHPLLPWACVPLRGSRRTLRLVSQIPPSRVAPPRHGLAAHPVEPASLSGPLSLAFALVRSVLSRSFSSPCHSLRSGSFPASSAGGLEVPSRLLASGWLTLRRRCRRFREDRAESIRSSVLTSVFRPLSLSCHPCGSPPVARRGFAEGPVWPTSMGFLTSKNDPKTFGRSASVARATQTTFARPVPTLADRVYADNVRIRVGNGRHADGYSISRFTIDE